MTPSSSTMPTAPTITDDAQLLARYAATRDAEAFAILVQRHAGWVHGVCRRVCGEQAEDATQECFWELARQARRIHGSVTGWLHRVAVRIAVRHRPRSTAPLPAAEPALPVDPQRSAWQRLAPLVDAELARLPDDQREALTLHFFAGLAQTEIAERCGVNQSTISRRIAEGVAALRRRLTSEHDDLPLAALLPCGALPLPPDLLGHVQRIGLAGPQPVAAVGMGTVAAIAGVLAAAVVAVAGLRQPLATPAPLPPPPVAVAVVAAVEPGTPPAPLPPTAPVLGDPLITLSVVRWPADSAVDLISCQVALARGQAVEIHPALRGSAPRVTLQVDGVPLTAVLDDLCRQAGWRQRRVGGVIAIDRPRPPAADHAPAALDPEGAYACGDLDALAALIGRLAPGAAQPALPKTSGDPLEQEVSLDVQDQVLEDVVLRLRQLTKADIVIEPQATATQPPQITLKVERMKLRFVLDYITKLTSLSYTLRDGTILIRAGEDELRQVEDLAVLTAIGRLGATRDAWAWRGHLPRVLATLPGVADGLAAAWRRATTAPRIPTPLLVHLVGLSTCPAPGLAELAEQEPPALADGAWERWYRLQVQWAARWALVQRKEAPRWQEWLATAARDGANDHRGLAAAQLASALAIQSPGLSITPPTGAALARRQSAWPEISARVALASLVAPAALVEQSRSSLANGWTDAFAGLPQAGLVGAFLQRPGRPEWWWTREAWLRGCAGFPASIDRAAVGAACTARLATQPDEPLTLALAAAAGDAAARHHLVEVLADGDPGDAVTGVLFRLVARFPPTAAAEFHRELAGRILPANGALSASLPVFSALLPGRTAVEVERISAGFASRPIRALALWLGVDGSPVAQQAVQRVVATLPPGDLNALAMETHGTAELLPVLTGLLRNADHVQAIATPLLGSAAREAATAALLRLPVGTLPAVGPSLDWLDTPLPELPAVLHGRVVQELTVRDSDARKRALGSLELISELDPRATARRGLTAITTACASDPELRTAAQAVLRDWLTLPEQPSGFEQHLQWELHAGWFDRREDRQAWDAQRVEIRAALLKADAEQQVKQAKPPQAEEDKKSNF